MQSSTLSMEPMTAQAITEQTMSMELIAVELTAGLEHRTQPSSMQQHVVQSEAAPTSNQSINRYATTL